MCLAVSQRMKRSTAVTRLSAASTHVEVYRKDPRRVQPAALEMVLLRELAAP